MALISRVLRLGRYATWTAFEQLISLGLPRLVLFPLLVPLLGEATFGSFVLALGIVQLIGVSPSNGFFGYLMREAAKHEAPDQYRMLRTAVWLSIGLCLVIFGGLALGAGPLAAVWSDPALATFLPWLSVDLFCLNVVTVAVTMFRVRRRFDLVLLTSSVRAAMLFLALPLGWIWGAAGVAGAFAVGGLGGLVTVLLLDPRAMVGRPLLVSRYVRGAFRVWGPLSLSSFIYLSAGYLDRLLLGFWWESREVAVFFAAAGTAQIFVVPGSQLSSLLLSLLAGVKHVNRFDRTFYARYAGAVGLVGLLVWGVGYIAGDVILTLLYPRLKAEALPLWPYAMAAAAAVLMMTGVRPFIVKFLSPNLIPLMTTVSLLARLGPLVVLVPTGGRLGAVQALAIGSMVTAALWVAIFAAKFIVGHPTARTGKGGPIS